MPIRIGQGEVDSARLAIHAHEGAASDLANGQSHGFEFGKHPCCSSQRQAMAIGKLPVGWQSVSRSQGAGLDLLGQRGDDLTELGTHGFLSCRLGLHPTALYA